jgi:predicted PurR-regulated permease PerM
VIVFLFWITIYYLWEPYQRGYLIQPWFVFAFVVIYTFHPAVEWLSQRRAVLRRDCRPAALFLRIRSAFSALSGRTSFLFHHSIGCGRGCCFI